MMKMRIFTDPKGKAPAAQRTKQRLPAKPVSHHLSKRSNRLKPGWSRDESQNVKKLEKSLAFRRQPATHLALEVDALERNVVLEAPAKRGEVGERVTEVQVIEAMVLQQP